MIINDDIRNLAAHTIGPFGVIIADPPWTYDLSIGEGLAKNEYDTLSTEDLCSVPVSSIAKQNSVCLLWGTWPKLPQAVVVLAAWKFDYVTGFPWIKTTANDSPVYNVGYWVRGCSEFVLIGRRGNVSPPKTHGWLGLMSPNVAHSRKPDSLYDYAESLPGPYIELFARRSRSGWVSYGNEMGGALKRDEYNAAQPLLMAVD